MEHDVMAAGDTADIETGQLLIKTAVCVLLYFVITKMFQCWIFLLIEAHIFIILSRIRMNSFRLAVVYLSILQHKLDFLFDSYFFHS